MRGPNSNRVSSGVFVVRKGSAARISPGEKVSANNHSKLESSEGVRGEDVAMLKQFSVWREVRFGRRVVSLVEREDGVLVFR